jgi:hypothetical protein
LKLCEILSQFRGLPSRRSLKIMAEAFAIKGFCYERLPVQTGNRGKLQEREHKITRCFELSADLTLLYLQVRTVKANQGLFVMGSCVYTSRKFTRR